MSLLVGHRNGIKLKLSHRHGLTRIAMRFGIPFYSSADVYDEQHNYISESSTSIRFRARGKITGSGGALEPSALDGSSLFRFLCSATLTAKTVPVVTDEIRQINGETNIRFWHKGSLMAYRRTSGVSWMVFNCKALYHRLFGSTNSAFMATGTLKGHVLRGRISLVFSSEIGHITDGIITEDTVYYLTTEDGVYYLKQE